MRVRQPAGEAIVAVIEQVMGVWSAEAAGGVAPVCSIAKAFEVEVVTEASGTALEALD